MARGKESLSFEERLEQALVPVAGQPYVVQENWVWTRFSTLKYRSTDFFDGDWILSENMDSKGSVRLLQLSDIGIGEFLNKSTKFISTDTFSKLNCSEIFEGDILVSRMAEPIARSCIVPKLNNVLITAVDVAVLRCNQSIAKNKYVNYLCNAPWFTELANKLARGTTRVRITRKNLGDMPIPLPPLAEQQRIVDRIESLFAKLDEAKEKAQAALDSFENRKVAILHQAFTGELTKKWREENGVGVDSWEEKALKDICIIRAGYAFDSKKFSNTGYQVIRMGNLYNGTLDLERNPVFIPHKEIDKKTLAKAIINCGDILLTLTGTKYKRDYGYAVFVDIAGLLLNQRIIAMTPSKINSRFLLFTLQSNYFRDIFFSNETGGVNQGNVSSKFVENINVKYPSLPEQNEIVRILDSIFDKEKQAKELANVIEKIDLMKKAILARAFRGELGTNDPTDEPAIELLKRQLMKK